MQARVPLDVVVRQGVSVLKLFARKDESLLVPRDAFLVLDHFLDLTDGGCRGYIVQCYGFSGYPN